jgi:hypothetical protein
MLRVKIKHILKLFKFVFLISVYHLIWIPTIILLLGIAPAPAPAPPTRASARALIPKFLLKRRKEEEKR